MMVYVLDSVLIYLDAKMFSTGVCLSALYTEYSITVPRGELAGTTTRETGSLVLIFFWEALLLNDTHPQSTEECLWV